MKFKIKNEKERLIAEEKARKEEEERLRIEEEKRAKVREMIIYGVIGLVILAGVAIGYLVWRKKQASKAIESENPPFQDSPPSVS